nr:unnamed protein product [Callosobruchus analis]
MLPEHNSDRFTIANYKLLRNDRPDRGGGVAVYVKEHLKPIILLKSESGSIVEHLWISVKCNNVKIAIGVVYLPHTKDFKTLDFMYEVIPILYLSCSICICTGDFNIDLRKSTPESRYFMNILDNLDLVQIIKDSTRLTNDSETLLDLIIVDNLDCISECGVIECGLVHSDHEAVYCYLSIDNNLENNKYLEKFQKY